MDKRKRMESRLFLQEKKKRFPSRYDLDKISTTNPIVVTRACGHVVVVNSKALEVLNIGKRDRAN